MRTVFNILRSLVYASGFLFVWGWLAWSARSWDERWAEPLPAWVQPIGAVVFVMGAGLALWCVLTFASFGRGTPAPFDPPRRFVVRGPYRFVRNPMYIGGIAMLLGFGLWFRSPSASLFIILAAIIAHGFVLFVEEPGLKRRFGESYQVYLKSVHRWRPRWPQ